MSSPRRRWPGERGWLTWGVVIYILAVAATLAVVQSRRPSHATRQLRI